MFAFGIGVQEMIVLLMIALLMMGVPFLACFLAISLWSRGRQINLGAKLTPLEQASRRWLC